MKPPADWAVEGRVNPKGIPVLYVASIPETAMSEVRPSLALPISLAELNVERELRLVDCTIQSGSITSKFGEGLSRTEREEMVWHFVNDAFMKPVDANEKLADYAPTQIIAECFRRAGYDGVRYRSGLGNSGHNTALFNVADATVVGDVRLMRANSISMTFTTYP